MYFCYLIFRKKVKMNRNIYSISNIKEQSENICCLWRNKKSCSIKDTLFQCKLKEKKKIIEFGSIYNMICSSNSHNMSSSIKQDKNRYNRKYVVECFCKNKKIIIREFPYYKDILNCTCFVPKERIRKDKKEYMLKRFWNKLCIHHKENKHNKRRYICIIKKNKDPHKTVDTWLKYSSRSLKYILNKPISTNNDPIRWTHKKIPRKNNIYDISSISSSSNSNSDNINDFYSIIHAFTNNDTNNLMKNKSSITLENMLPLYRTNLTKKRSTRNASNNSCCENKIIGKNIDSVTLNHTKRDIHDKEKGKKESGISNKNYIIVDLINNSTNKIFSTTVKNRHERNKRSESMIHSKNNSSLVESVSFEKLYIHLNKNVILENTNSVFTNSNILNGSELFLNNSIRDKLSLRKDLIHLFLRVIPGISLIIVLICFMEFKLKHSNKF